MNSFDSVAVLYVGSICSSPSPSSLVILNHKWVEYSLLSVENSGFLLAVSWDGCIQCTQVPMFIDHSGSPHAYLCSSFFSLSVILNIPGVWNNWALLVFRFCFPLFEPRGWTGRASCQRFMGHSLLLALCPKSPQFLHFTCVDFGMNTEWVPIPRNYQSTTELFLGETKPIS